MIMPEHLLRLREWTVVGPLGPHLPSPLATLPILSIDGGVTFSDRSDIWVGDGDSSEREFKADHIFRHSVEKDQSDLALGLSLFNERHFYKLHLWGFLGGRRDHELFNLGEALAFLDQHPESEVLFYDDRGRITFHCLGEGDWKFQHQGVFSLGAIKNTLIRLSGDCHFPLSKETLISPLSSVGLSNIARGEVELQTDGSVFVYFPEGL